MALGSLEALYVGVRGGVEHSPAQMTTLHTEDTHRSAYTTAPNLKKNYTR